MGLALTPGAHEVGSRTTPDALPAPARAAVEDLLARLDRALPGRVEGFYVAASACLGAFREGRSDVDFVAILNGELDRAELRRLRALHLGRWIRALVRDAAPTVAGSRSGATPTICAPGRSRTCTATGAGGPSARGGQGQPSSGAGSRPGAVLGVARLHYTLATGEIASKEAAGVYALAAFDGRWREVIDDALAFWRGGPPAPAYRRHPGRRRRDAADFVAHVIDAVRGVPGLRSRGGLASGAGVTARGATWKRRELRRCVRYEACPTGQALRPRRDRTSSWPCCRWPGWPTPCSARR